MADWIDVNEEQFTALEALGAPTRVVHQAKVPKTWDVSALGVKRTGIKRPKSRVPHNARTKYRLGLGSNRATIAEGSNLELAYKAIKTSMKSSVREVRTRTSITHTVTKAVSDVGESSVSSMISILFSRGFLVVVDDG